MTDTLKLADYCESLQMEAVAAELRRLHEVNQELLEALKYYAYTYCEGWCKEGSVSREDIKDCGGCFARITIAKAEGEQA